MNKKTNLIGISGRIGSGKDTIGKIIQYLDLQKNYPNIWKEKTFNQFLNFGSEVGQHTWESDWKIKKFAYKLKQIASILTGISITDLEKQEVKDSYLGEEWNKYYKNNNWNDIELLKSFADEEKITLEEYIIKNNYEKISDETYRNINQDKISKFQIREFLQKLGTEAIRDNIHPDTWVNALFVDYKQCNTGRLHELMDDSNNEIKNFPNWCITDMRFPNELKAVEDRNGITIRVNRPLTKKFTSEDGKSSAQVIMIDFNAHPSETALDKVNFKYTIENDGTIEELIEKVKEILIKEKII